MMLSLVADGIASKIITVELLNQICAKHGIDNYPLLSARPDLIKPIHDELFSGIPF